MMTTVHRAVAVVVLMTMGLLAGCSSGAALSTTTTSTSATSTSTSSTTTTTSVSPSLGIVSGEVERCGGFAPGRCIALSGVVTLNAHGKTYSTPIKARGEWSIAVRPGKYVVAWRHSVGVGHRTVTVAAGEVVRGVNLVAQVP